MTHGDQQDNRGDPARPVEILSSSAEKPASSQAMRRSRWLTPRFVVPLLLAVVAGAVLLAQNFSNTPDPSAQALAYTASAQDTINVGGGANGVTVDPKARRLYVAGTSPSTGRGTLSIIDPESKTVDATIEVGKYPGKITIGPDGRTVYVAVDTGLAVVDTQAGVVSDTVELGGHPRGLTLVGTDLYVAHPSSFDPTKLQPGDKLGDKMPTVSVIDTKTNTVTATLSTGFQEPLAIAADPAFLTVYVVNIANELTQIDTRFRMPVKTSQIDPGKIVAIMGLAVQGGRLYAAGADPTQGMLRDITGGVPGRAISLPGQPGQVVIDGKTAYVIIPDVMATEAVPDVPASGEFPGITGHPARHARDGGLAIVDLDARAVTDIVQVGASPLGVTVDPDTHTVYVANEDATVSVIKRSS